MIARPAAPAARETAERRLALLRLLRDSRGYRANEALLRMACADRGHVVSADRLRTDLAWLAEQDLAAVEEIGGVAIATLTARGADAATGAAAAPGVARPAPPRGKTGA